MSTKRHDVRDDKALAEIQGLAWLDRIVVTWHGRQRMAERDVTEHDVRWALRTATEAFRQGDRENWRVEGGVDLREEDLTLVCDLADDVIVVTVF
jgi:hypothetical protein